MVPDIGISIVLTHPNNQTHHNSVPVGGYRDRQQFGYTDWFEGLVQPIIGGHLVSNIIAGAVLPPTQSNFHGPFPWRNSNYVGVCPRMTDPLAKIYYPSTR